MWHHEKTLHLGQILHIDFITFSDSTIISVLSAFYFIKICQLLPEILHFKDMEVRNQETEKNAFEVGKDVF